MSESERLQRFMENGFLELKERNDLDEILEKRIVYIINHPGIDKFCMVDAYYYDYSVIPDEIRNEFNLYRDSYLIFGITDKGKIISKWIDRWDLDSKDPIVDGKVIRSNKPTSPIDTPGIKVLYDPKLLSYPTPKIFDK